MSIGTFGHPIKAFAIIINQNILLYMIGHTCELKILVCASLHGDLQIEPEPAKLQIWLQYLLLLEISRWEQTPWSRKNNKYTFFDTKSIGWSPRFLQQ